MEGYARGASCRSDALPLLQKAESVMIVEMSEEDDGSGRTAEGVAALLDSAWVEIVAERCGRSKSARGRTASLVTGREDQPDRCRRLWALAIGRMGLRRGHARAVDESPVCCLFSH